LITFGSDETDFTLPASYEYSLLMMGETDKIACILRYTNRLSNAEMLICKRF